MGAQEGRPPSLVSAQDKDHTCMALVPFLHSLRWELCALTLSDLLPTLGANLFTFLHICAKKPRFWACPCPGG